MSATGLEVFDTTLQKTNLWLNELMGILGWEDKHKAYRAMRAVLHTLRDRLTVDEAAQLGAQLPMLLRGIYYEGWDPTSNPRRIRHVEEFLATVDEQFREDSNIDPEQITRGVLAVLANRVTQGEIQDVKHALPVEFQDLWPHEVHP
jgi:uncharacterized protein (DUF2267 family)